jgi:hypothetical protein
MIVASPHEGCYCLSISAIFQQYHYFHLLGKPWNVSKPNLSVALSTKNVSGFDIQPKCSSMSFADWRAMLIVGCKGRGFRTSNNKYLTPVHHGINTNLPSKSRLNDVLASCCSSLLTLKLSVMFWSIFNCIKYFKQNAMYS